MKRFLGNIGLFTWLFMSFGIAALIGANALQSTQDALSKDGALAEATITEKFQKRAEGGGYANRYGGDRKGIMEYYLRYRFELPSGKIVEAVKRVEQDYQESLSVGDALPVRYTPADPNLSQIQFNEYAEGAEAVMAFAGLFLLFTAFGLIWALIRTLRGPAVKT